MSLGFTDFTTEKFVIKMLSGLFDGNTDIVENILHMLDLPHPALARRAALPRNWVERSQRKRLPILCNDVSYLYDICPEAFCFTKRTVNGLKPFLGPGF